MQVYVEKMRRAEDVGQHERPYLRSCRTWGKASVLVLLEADSAFDPHIPWDGER